MQLWFGFLITNNNSLTHTPNQSRTFTHFENGIIFSTMCCIQFHSVGFFSNFIFVVVSEKFTNKMHHQPKLLSLIRIEAWQTCQDNTHHESKGTQQKVTMCELEALLSSAISHALIHTHKPTALFPLRGNENKISSEDAAFVSSFGFNLIWLKFSALFLDEFQIEYMFMKR